MPDRPLAGLGIAITRPSGQARMLADRVRECGGEPVLFPLLAIAPLENYSVCDTVIGRLADCDWAIFISSNAVEHGMARIRMQYPSLPERLRFAAIGPSSANSLQETGVLQVLTPASRYDSEGLLALPEFQHIRDKRVMLFRGVGGRELLADTLRSRGAEVHVAECYRRRNPMADTADLPRLWHNGKLHAMVVTSSEALRNLLAIADGQAWLRDILLCVNHPRIAELACRHGLKTVTSNAPDDEALLQCLIENCPGH